jgi:hypothetical protein
MKSEMKTCRILSRVMVMTASCLVLASCPPPGIDTLPRVAMPLFSVPSGTYDSQLLISISCATDGSHVYYTTDGTSPSEENGALYSETLSILFSGSLKAVGTKPGMRDSEIAEAQYVISKPPGQVPAPVFGLASGTYHTDLYVGITVAMPGAAIRYTTDGGDPLTEGTPYEGPVQVSEPTTLRAAASRDGWLDSAVSSATYSFKAAPPVLIPPGRDYPSMTKEIVISTLTPGASIRYTDDGSEPTTEAGTLYTNPVTVLGVTTIKAMAYRQDWESSPVSMGVYTTGKFTGGGGSFASSMARSGDDTLIAIGAPKEQIKRGAVYLFRQLGESCAQIARLAPAGTTDPGEFGTSIAVSHDGSFVAVGAYGDAEEKGAAYLYRKDPERSIYADAGVIRASDGIASDWFGCSLGVAADASILAVGAPGCASSQGAVYLFRDDNNVWKQVQKLVASDGAPNDRFGSCIAFSGDGTRLVVGAYNDDGRCGAAYLFTQSGDTWTETQKLVAEVRSTIDQFGSSASFSADSSTIAIGADMKGFVTMFANPGSGWEVAQTLVPSVSDTYSFGASLSISSDADVLIVGAPIEDEGLLEYQGSAFVFERSAGTWMETQRLTAPTGAERQRCGASVLVSSDGSGFIVGCPGDPDEWSGDFGSAYRF